MRTARRRRWASVAARFIAGCRSMAWDLEPPRGTRGTRQEAQEAQDRRHKGHKTGGTRGTRQVWPENRLWLLLWWCCHLPDLFFCLSLCFLYLFVAMIST